MAQYFVYIIECEKWKYIRKHSESIFVKTLFYTGITTNPKKRLIEHKNGILSGWMSNNNIRPLHFVYMECTGSNYNDCIKREKQIKEMNLSRKKKLIIEYDKR